MMSMIQLIGALELGIIFGLIGMAVFITFRVSDFPDLTIDGTFPLGAATSAALIVYGMNPWLATACAIAAGALAGMATAYLHVRWKIMPLLAGIIIMTALYSINLRIMGQPNIAIFDHPTVFDIGLPILVTLSIAAVSVAACIIYFLATEYGLGLRASGMNKRVSLALGIHVNKATIVSLAMSNGFVALAGALYAQSQGFADISMGTGIIVVGLAAVIIGQTLIRTRKIAWLVIACILGAIIYRLAIALALNTHALGLQASDLNALTAIVVILTLIIPAIKKEISEKRGALS